MPTGYSSDPQPCCADPLRVLRAVRFTSRYAFTMVPELREAAASEEVLTALERKIARERVGSEVAGCLTGPHPLLAVQLFHELRALPAVLQPPEAMRAALGVGAGASCVRALELAYPLLTSYGQRVRSAVPALVACAFAYYCCHAAVVLRVDSGVQATTISSTQKRLAHIDRSDFSLCRELRSSSK